MYEDDYLLREIRRAIEALARLARGEQVPRDEIDQAVRDAVGLDLATLDLLPTDALLAMHVPGDARSIERLRTLTQILEATADPGPAGDLRRAKAATLQARLGTN